MDPYIQVNASDPLPASTRQIPAGVHRTRILLQKRYRALGCRLCGKDKASPNDGHVYLNCPRRPCFLCKKDGHTVFSCPHRNRPRENLPPSRNCHGISKTPLTLHTFLKQRQTTTTMQPLSLPSYHIPNRQFDCEIALFAQKIHQSRITALEWHPSGRFIFTGDNHGTLRILSLSNSIRQSAIDPSNPPRYNTACSEIHHCTVNNIVFNPVDNDVCYSTSTDGTVSRSQISLLSGEHRRESNDPITAQRTILDLNPNGWQGRTHKFSKTIHGMAADGRRNCVYVGVSNGAICRFDPREPTICPTDVEAKFHCDKVTCIDINPVDNDLIVSSSNDRNVSLWDARKFVREHAIGSYQHERVVSSAYFSPNTGAKLLTTTQGNKLRIWGSLHGFQGYVNDYRDSAPLTITHSHDFHYRINPFRALWDPKDWRDDLFLCGRFLGEAYFDKSTDEDELEANLLHPIDMFSAETGDVVHSLVDRRLSFLCPTNKFSPTEDIIASVYSTNMVIWSPPIESGQKDEGLRRRSGIRPLGRKGSDSDNESDDNPGGRIDGGLTSKKKLHSVVVRRKQARAKKKRVS